MYFAPRTLIQKAILLPRPSQATGYEIGCIRVKCAMGVRSEHYLDRVSNDEDWPQGPYRNRIISFRLEHHSFTSSAITVRLKSTFKLSSTTRMWSTVYCQRFVPLNKVNRRVESFLYEITIFSQCFNEIDICPHGVFDMQS